MSGAGPEFGDAPRDYLRAALDELELHINRSGDDDAAEHDGMALPLALPGADETVQRLAQLMGRALEQQNLRHRAERERLNLALTRQAAFLADASHELRTPLTLVLGPLDMVLKSGEVLSPLVRDMLERAERNAWRLREMVGEVLDFAKIEAEGSALRALPLDVVGFVTQLVEDVQPTASRAGISLTAHLDAQPGEVCIDKLSLQKIVFNFLGNALKFTPRGGTIAVALQFSAHDVLLQVEDNGLGIAREHQALVFKRFQQVSVAGPGHETGSGLGLALVRQFATLMGGEVGLESEVGRGALFWVRLPRWPPPSLPELPPASFTPAAVRAGASGGRDLAGSWREAKAEDESTPAAVDGVLPGDLPRLLLADDDAEMRDYVALLLREQWRVTMASNGREALLAIEEAHDHHDPFDVVIADVQMPEMDGLELVQRLKTDLPLRRLPMRRLPVVLLTAHSGPEAAAVGQEGGADDYLAKPFSEAELKARLRAALHMHRVTRELDAANAVLQQSNEELREFAYVASHDLQEPLRKVRAFGNLLRAEYGPLLTGAGLDYLMRMEGAAERMQILIRDLLSLSRVMTVNNSFAPVDLNQVVAEVLSDLEARALQSGAHIATTLLPTLEADAVQMRQLLQNLIGNALKFVSSDRAPQVVVTGEIVDGMCRLRVSDNGIGFEPGEAAAIFAPFYRLHAQHNFEGTGIGLAICRKIAERHGGSIAAQGKPAVGAVFVVSLPLRQ